MSGQDGSQSKVGPETSQYLKYSVHGVWLGFEHSGIAK